ncbi:MAG: sulfite exporter TauE/SafE family protein [Planctomycetes bacterium]|nr:sulfite exporter TauE/SafE family protein [Planctomycetota bacterium]
MSEANERCQRERYRLAGMVCRSCEGKVTAKLRALPGVCRARADYRRSLLEVEYDATRTSPDAMRQALEEMGYDLGERDPATETLRTTLGRVAGLVVVILAIHTLIRRFGLLDYLNIFPEAEIGMGYGMIFLVGLLTSTHCVAMCGGINLSQTVLSDAAPATTAALFRPTLLYGAGRVLSYTLIGAVSGGFMGAVVGATVARSGYSGDVKGLLQVAFGIFMMIVGVNISGLFPWFSRMIPSWPRLYPPRSSGTGRGPFYVGLLNGLMPCGPLQAMQLYALSTGSLLQGAASMFLFAAGTLPLTMGLGVAGRFLGRRFMGRFIQAGAALVFLMGFAMLGNGLRLSGYATFTFASGGEAVRSVVMDGMQVLETRLGSGDYPAVHVQAGLPLRWNLRAEPGTVNGCNNRIFIPEFAIEKRLELGDNIIEFTPTAPGVYPYMCWMGMIASRIIVGDVADPGETPEYDPSFLPGSEEDMESDVPW